MAMKAKNDGRCCNATLPILVLVVLLQSCAEAFTIGRGNARLLHHPVTVVGPAESKSKSKTALSNSDVGGGDKIIDDVVGDISVGSYRHKNFKLTYLHKKASPGREGDRPIILIHPVGIGLSSWFWEKVMNSYSESGRSNPPIYAPDLIGCGIDHGADAWRPEENGLFFPLSWAEGVETLMNDVIVPRWQEKNRSSSSSSPLSRFWGDDSTTVTAEGVGCLVIAQGGLAPVGIVLAERNPLLVGRLMLTSPPTYEEMVTAVPEEELRRNYDFLRSPILGRAAFALLESRGAIRFFSNLFLFADECDEEWLDETERESRTEASRAPVQAFNAGLLQHRSFEEELGRMVQPVSIVSGEGDKRVSGRLIYREKMSECTLTTIEGCNVLPWETPNGIVELIERLGY